VGTAHLFPPAIRFRSSRLRRVVAGTTAAVIAVALGVTPAIASGHAKHRHGHGPSVTSEPWGSTTEGNVERWTLNNGHGMTVKILTYGGIIQSLYVPDRSGHRANVALGFDNLPDYVAKSPYFGCITGRYANRIAKGQFSIDGNDYQLTINNDPNSLHGGTVGFDKHIWATTSFKHGSSVGLVMKYTSPDGDQGYPGTLQSQVTYTLTKSDTLKMNYQATTDKPTIVNLTNHSFFNLAGEGSGRSILDNVLTIPAEPRFRSVATLVVGGIGSRADLPYERADDLQLAVLSALDAGIADEMTVEVDASDGRLEIAVGPVRDGSGEDAGLVRVLSRLVDDVASQRREGAEWLTLVVSDGRTG